MNEDRAYDEAHSAAILLASEIKRRRHQAELSQPQLARRIGYTRQYVSLAERPGHNLPSLGIVKAIDEELGAGGQLLALREQAHRERQARRNRPDASAGPQTPISHADTAGTDPLGGVPLLSGLASSDIPDLLGHLREQWHLLVKTDNLFGPRFALSSVHEHLRLVMSIARSARGLVRREVVTLAAQYAESAAWLHEDAGETSLAERWTDRAMEWSHEADDRLMLAWTLFRRSQQATTNRDPARVIGMAHAAHREGPALPPSMRAAITQQEAHGYALDGDARAAQRTLDKAHEWAVSDTTGDARGGHGSFCTAGYLELQRASCWLTLGQPRKAVELYDRVLPILPAVYRRDRGIALGRFALASAAVGEPERAARLAGEALDIARSSGSVRTENELRAVANALTRYDTLPSVAAFRAKLTFNGDL
ncbi:helix-turn-helix transcriptional regulator [Saccharothrix luteola]|uniref:helix-turn-helix transcriptional regulator n=1 Tax=Saccharothrix luteola TaxID=2893018 RepID=UPI001E40205A|nr:helix-turn-helix transcriptional regulator [Saccharothrix luteola]MCC8245046.1 helix-turn-helix transcriptional regulator [Saccharothrix luteola]